MPGLQPGGIGRTGSWLDAGKEVRMRRRVISIVFAAALLLALGAAPAQAFQIDVCVDGSCVGLADPRSSPIVDELLLNHADNIYRRGTVISRSVEEVDGKVVLTIAITTPNGWPPAFRGR